MIYKNPDVDKSCFGKKLPFPSVDIEGTYECGKCWRKMSKLSPASPAGTAEKCVYIDPWPDFTPCQNFLPLKWSAPLSDEEMKAMCIPIIESLPQYLEKSLNIASEISKTDADFCSAIACLARTARGWDKDGNCDYALGIERQLVADVIYHELQRRKHD
jgi:hypothetical protein